MSRDDEVAGDRENFERGGGSEGWIAMASQRADTGCVDACSDRFHGFLPVDASGTIALPPLIRDRYHLNRPGAQLEMTERADSVLELRPAEPAPASEGWFWHPDWQAGEREADADIAAGNVTVFDGTDEFVAHLDTISNASHADDSPEAR